MHIARAKRNFDYTYFLIIHVIFNFNIIHNSLRFNFNSTFNSIFNTIFGYQADLIAYIFIAK